ERTGKSKVKPFRDILRTLQIMTQMMIYYNPLKLAATAAAGIASAALAVYAVFGLWLDTPTALPAAVILAATSVVVFFLGCLLDAVRLHFAAQKGPMTLD
ncbi:MAG: hypothetical protein KGJ84_17885, partial [Elusimicrobia bacterium]|nr:hypothetical protein [Elusimicrobiota bacterium]